MRLNISKKDTKTLTNRQAVTDRVSKYCVFW